MNITELYARRFGISDLDIAEAEWLAHWVRRHSNSMTYDAACFRWVWSAA